MSPGYTQWTIPSLLYQGRRNIPLVHKGIICSDNIGLILLYSIGECCLGSGYGKTIFSSLVLPNIELGTRFTNIVAYQFIICEGSLRFGSPCSISSVCESRGRGMRVWVVCMFLCLSEFQGKIFVKETQGATGGHL